MRERKVNGPGTHVDRRQTACGLGKQVPPLHGKTAAAGQTDCRTPQQAAGRRVEGQRSVLAKGKQPPVDDRPQEKPVGNRLCPQDLPRINCQRMDPRRTRGDEETTAIVQTDKILAPGGSTNVPPGPRTGVPNGPEAATVPPRAGRGRPSGSCASPNRRQRQSPPGSGRSAIRSARRGHNSDQTTRPNRPRSPKIQPGSFPSGHSRRPDRAASKLEPSFVRPITNNVLSQARGGPRKSMSWSACRGPVEGTRG